MTNGHRDTVPGRWRKRVSFVRCHWCDQDVKYDREGGPPRRAIDVEHGEGPLWTDAPHGLGNIGVLVYCSDACAAAHAVDVAASPRDDRLFLDGFSGDVTIEENLNLPRDHPDRVRIIVARAPSTSGPAKP